MQWLSLLFLVFLWSQGLIRLTLAVFGVFRLSLAQPMDFLGLYLGVFAVVGLSLVPAKDFLDLACPGLSLLPILFNVDKQILTLGGINRKVLGSQRL